jgi:prepilin-type N-terminal cleavage/methylation domain-containing protein
LAQEKTKSEVVRQKVKPSYFSFGFTLVELLVALAITSAISGVMFMATTSIMKITPLNNDRAVILQQVQNAGHRLALDILSSDNVTPQPAPGVLVHLQQKSGWPVTTHTVEYVFDETTLRRRLDGNPPGALVAQYVVADGTSFSVSGNNTYTLTIMAAKGDVELQRNYDMTRRSAVK